MDILDPVHIYVYLCKDKRDDEFYLYGQDCSPISINFPNSEVRTTTSRQRCSNVLDAVVPAPMLRNCLAISGQQQPLKI